MNLAPALGIELKYAPPGPSSALPANPSQHSKNSMEQSYFLRPQLPESGVLAELHNKCFLWRVCVWKFLFVTF